MTLKELNKQFIDQFNDNHEKVNAMLLAYLKIIAKSACEDASNISAKLSKLDNKIKLSLNVEIKGKAIDAHKEWDEDFILSLEIPVTRLFKDLFISMCP